MEIVKRNLREEYLMEDGIRCQLSVQLTRGFWSIVTGKEISSTNQGLSSTLKSLNFFHDFTFFAMIPRVTHFQVLSR